VIQVGFQLTLNSELLSGTSSAVLSKLKENHGEIQKIMSGLESLSISVPAELEEKCIKILELQGVVSGLAESNIKRMDQLSLGMSDVQGKLQGNTHSRTISEVRLTSIQMWKSKQC
jgi:hypothetical protein